MLNNGNSILDGFIVHSHKQYLNKLNELLGLENIRLQELECDLAKISMGVQDYPSGVLIAEESLMTRNECNFLATLSQRFPNMHFVLVSVSSDAQLLHKLLNRFKVTALMGRHATSGEIALSIKAAGFGSMMLSSDLSQLLTLTPLPEEPKQPATPTFADENLFEPEGDQSRESLDTNNLPNLSKRETEILHLVARGLQSKQIGPILGISVRTVEVHRSNIRRKIGGRGLNAMIALSNHIQTVEARRQPTEANRMLT